MAEWHRIATLEDVPLGSGKTVMVEKKRFAVFHLALGFFVLDDHCCYSDGLLSGGKIQGHEAVCLQHGCRFNIVSGECTNNKDFQLGTYRVKTTESEVFVRFR
jgi:nitrite reductase/ring-hydroxylating ferredoxin subunit